MAISSKAMDELTLLTEVASSLHTDAVLSAEGFKANYNRIDVCKLIEQLVIHVKQLQLEVVSLRQHVDEIRGHLVL